MEAAILKIKCPCCGVVLTVKNQPGIEQKSITCPVCKETSPFGSFKQPVMNKAQVEHTQYPSDKQHPGSHEETHVNQAQNEPNFTLGELFVEGSQLPPFRLKAGRNVIGRKATASSADLQIPVLEGNRMSREHLVIEVKKIPGKGFVHYASLYKEKVNATSINDIRLEFGDSVILQHGDTLRLPDVTLRFEIPDGESTGF